MTAPARMSLTNTDTGETLVVQFNPEKISAKLEPVFAELDVLGASGQDQQFRLLKNAQIDLELRFDALVQREWDADKITSAINFILALATPRSGDSVQDIDPPYVLFVWPRLYTLVGRIWQPSVEDLRFARTGARTLSVVKFQIRKIYTARRTSAEVRQKGLNA